ncbi:hypothetical protein VTN96DRAFT_10388 [Rasamsonia emersonii]
MNPEVANEIENRQQEPTPERKPYIPLPPPAPPSPSYYEELRRRFPPPPPLPPDAGRLPGDPQEKPPFKPCHLFFYGSLMDPEVLQSVLGLPELPVLQKGWVTGFTIKMWGIYPALIPKDGDTKVMGAVWKVDEPSQFLRLMEYETEAYKWCPCTVHLCDGGVLPESRTFIWAGDPASKDLEDGSFDLERYQKYFKPSVVRKHTTE